MSNKIKKELRIKVEETLNATLTELQGDVSPKKLKRNIRKASKVLLQGLKISTPEKPLLKKDSKKKTAVEANTSPAA